MRFKYKIKLVGAWGLFLVAFFVVNLNYANADDCQLGIYDGSSKIRVSCEPAGTVTSPLRMRKNGATYGIVLVDPNDPYATKVRIKTAAGIKALQKFPAACLLYNNIHTCEQCIAAGGTVVSDGTNNFCRFNSGSCPGGWTKYGNWTTTSPHTCSYTGCISSACTTSSHGWANIAPESCSYVNGWTTCASTGYWTRECVPWYCFYYDDIPPGFHEYFCGDLCTDIWHQDCASWYCATSGATCLANISQIGCY